MNWIKVGDRLPEKLLNRVFVIRKIDRKYMGADVAIYTKGQFYTGDATKFTPENELKNVTHWMDIEYPND